MSKSKKDKQAQYRSELQNEAFNPKLESIAKEAAITHDGSGTVLESAIGAMYVGQIFGWKVLRIMHGSSAYNKYERILGIKFKDVCPERGPLAKRSVGLRFADTAGGFWKVATGKIPGRSPDLNDEVDIQSTPD